MSKLKKINNEQTAYFCEQLWLMLNSGIRLNDGLDILAEDMEDAQLRQLCNKLSESICSGNPLHTAMEQSGVFPDYAVKMTEIGVVTGRLDDVLKGLAEYYDNRSEAMRTVRYAVIHPLLILAMMSAVMLVLSEKVIPMFDGIFTRLDAAAAATVEDTVRLAQSVGRISAFVMLGIAAAAAVIILIPPVGKAAVRLMNILPFASKLSARFELAKLTDAMSMMISSGIDPENALEHTLDIVSHKHFRKKLVDCLERVRGSEYFADAICRSGLLPSVYSRSLAIAYSSGSFEIVWKKISKRCAEQADNTAAALVSVIEPVIIALLAVMIGSVMLAVMLPLMNIMSALG